MRILSFQAENFKKLKVVSFTPDKNKVLISGANEQGKSSILDAIQVALCGKDSLKKIPEPIRKGEKSGSIHITIGEDDAKYIVTRTFTQKDSYLIVETPEGARHGSPQKLLDELFNKKTIDPSEFLVLDDEKQLKLIKEIADIPINLDELEEKKQTYYDERTIVNREVKSLESRFSALPIPEPNLPLEEISASEILNKIEDATTVIAENNEKRETLKSIANEFNQLKAEKLKLEEQKKELEQKIISIDKKLNERQIEGKQLKAEVEKLIDPDITQYTNELKNLEATNKKIRNRNDFISLESQILKKKQERENLTSKITELELTKEDALKKAKFPIQGLGITDNGITFKGIPFSQASQEERIRVSLSIAMAQNPTLRVIMIRDASLLDSRNLKVIEEIAEAKDYQIWLEKVDETGKVGIMIEDGEIKSSTQEPDPIKEPVRSTSRRKVNETELNFECGEEWKTINH